MIARLAAIAVLLAAATAHADADADARITRARALHEQGRHDAALAELRAAYDLDPRPDLLFAMAQMEFNLGRYQAALALYERFLATDPDPRKAALAHQAIGACRERLAEQAAAAPRPPTPAPPPPTPPPLVDDGPAFDRWSLGLVVTGAAIGAGAGGLYLHARRQAGDLSGDYGGFERRYDGARDLRAASAIVGGAAALLVGAGLTRWLVRAGDDDRDVAASIWLDGDGAGLAIGGAL